VPISDRELPTDRLGKERNRSSWILILTVALVTVLMLSAIPGLIGHSGEGPAPVRVLALTSHGPIFIDSNDGFTNASGVVWGNGTLSDPYIIEEWDINASAADGIAICNTSAYFIVRACYFHDGRPNNNAGIHLNNCTNGVLDNNTCSNNMAGILLDISSSNAMLGNTCSSNNGSGIDLYSSSENILAFNDCSNNSGGISLSQSNNNVLSNNNWSDNWGGIYVLQSSNNTLSNNGASSNDDVGIVVAGGGTNTLRWNNCSCNGHGILIWQSSYNTLTNSNSSDNDDYGIGLFSSNYNALSDNYCSKNGNGTFLFQSSGNTLNNNTCDLNIGDGLYLDQLSDSNILYDNNCGWNGRWGIQTRNSSGNVMIRNQLCDNLQYGVGLKSGSFHNLVYNNTLIGNNGAGSTYDPAHVQTRDDGTDNWWNSTDGYGNYWSDWTGPDAGMDGIVDAPYILDGSAGAKDNLPLTTPPAPKPEYCTGSVITTDELGDSKSTFIQGQSVYVNVLAMYHGFPSDLVVTVSLVDLNGSVVHSFTVHTNDPVVGWYNSSVAWSHLTLGTNVPVSGVEQAFNVTVKLSGSGHEIARTVIVIKKAGLRFDPVQNDPAYWPGQLINATLVTPHTTEMFYIHVVNETGGSAGVNWTYQSATDGTWEKQFVIRATWPTGDYVMKVRSQETSAIWYSLLFHVINSPPIAEAGPNQTVTVGDIVVFNGSGSSDDGGVVNWTWTFSYDGNITELYESQPTFRLDREGVYEVTLVVRDGAGNTASDTMNVTVETAIPEVSNAGVVVAVVVLCAIMLVVTRDKRDLEGI